MTETFFSKKTITQEYSLNDMWRNGGSGGNFSAIPPQAPLPQCCVIKNVSLIFSIK